VFGEQCFADRVSPCDSLYRGKHATQIRIDPNGLMYPGGNPGKGKIL